jgi:RNA polymerase sigma factor (TIGR02999 family)
MMSLSEPDITLLLSSLSKGDGEGLGQVMTLVYRELHAIAARHMRRERRDHTLRTTALVNEACMRLLVADVSFENRAHLLAFASTAMRRILVDHARASMRNKRGGKMEKIPLQSAESREALRLWADPAEILDLNQALDRLALQDDRKARLMEMHYFGGMNCDEVAAVLTVSVATVNRDLKLARAWLRRELNAVESGA